MKRLLRFFLFLLPLILLLSAAIPYLRTLSIPVLEPQGEIALKQKELFLTASFLMALVVVPVFILLAFFAWWYREGNPKARYAPAFAHSYLAECLWWGIPLVITVVLAYMTWSSSHELNPYKPLESDQKPLTIQVVALEWKWLFLYPDEGIATVNFIQFPAKRPLSFEITADAPMNSFWIPALGGQIYAMPAMKTQLHLIADTEGEFRGVSANISGEGFAGMWFTAKASSDEEFGAWVEKAKSSERSLGLKTYEELAKPSANEPVVLYRLEDASLFDNILRGNL